MKIFVVLTIFFAKSLKRTIEIKERKQIVEDQTLVKKKKKLSNPM